MSQEYECELSRTIVRRVSQSTSLQVVADSPEEARVKALRLARQGLDEEGQAICWDDNDINDDLDPSLDDELEVDEISQIENDSDA